MDTKKIDASNMRQVIVDSPAQLAKGLELAKDIKVSGNFSKALACGMGGSAHPANLLRAFGLPVSVHRDYNLPDNISSDTLVICISYSGNTEETLSCLQDALAKKLPLVVMASGGAMESLAEQNNIPFVKIPDGIQPRSAAGYIFSALAKVLENCGLAQDICSEIPKTVQVLQEKMPVMEKAGMDLAKKLVKKVPIIYASQQFVDVARIWKIKFNENTKIPAFFNAFPELNHNEMVGYSGLKNVGAGNFSIVILKDASGNPAISKRMNLTASLLQKESVKSHIVSLEGASLMEKAFSSLLLADWTSYYLALQYHTDPTPVKMVEAFKKLLQS